MISEKIHKLLDGGQFQCLEYSFREGKECFSLLKTIRKKGELTILSQVVFSSLPELSKELDAKKPLLLVYNHQVLTKKTAVADPDDTRLLHKAFAQIQEEAFYSDIFRKNGKSVVSIARKEEIDRWIEKFRQETGVDPVSVYLGIMPVFALDGLGREEFNTGGYQVRLVPEVELTPLAELQREEYDLSGLAVENIYLGGLGALLRFLGRGDYSGSIANRSMELSDRFRQSRLSSFLIKGMVGGVLVLLLANFLAFDYYFKKHQDLEQKTEANRSTLERIAALRQEIQKKEEKLSVLQSDKASRVSLLLSRLMETVPSTIRFDDLTYRPLARNIKPGEPVQYEDKVMRIEGSTRSQDGFTDWIARVEGLSGIQRVVIKTYERGDQKHHFVLQLEINDHETEY